MREKNSKKRKSKWRVLFCILKNFILFFLTLGFILATILTIYISQITLPDFSNFSERAINNSTQIYDRTGKILLYDIHTNVKRIQVTGEKISKYLKNATIAIEDKDFYQHKGIKPDSIIRAMLANLRAGKFIQGGSTIDQQVIKNALLTSQKNILRKVTEWAMAIKLDAQVSKDDILTIYLNEVPYGGNIYGIQMAAKYFFNKDAADLNLNESVYLAALPNAPSYYSPYGNHIEALENRKKIILQKMLAQKLITEIEYAEAKKTTVIWQQNNENGKALHFVFMVKDYLEQKYGKAIVDSGGLKIITTLNYDWQSQAEEIVKKQALENDKKHHATNASLVAIDPKTGQILTMVGSRDYFDTEIPGKFNIATALRQPGSAIKPIVYAAAFLKGYNPNTVLFDLETEFNTACDAQHNPLPQYFDAKCYHPKNYDNLFRGPVNLRTALGQSLNIPAVKLLYLTGINNAIATAQDLGITSLNPYGNYGLSLVLGSGEVSLLQLTNAYATFANNGTFNPSTFILSVTDKDGRKLENYNSNARQVLSENVTEAINDILADYSVKIPSYGITGPLQFSDRQVAVKTGTTNDFRDAWTIGYTPNIAVGVWVGNNDNTPINKKLSSLVAAPLWRVFMNVVNASSSIEYFSNSSSTLITNNPAINGIYCQNLNDQDQHNFSTILSQIISKENLNPAQNNFSDPMSNLWQKSINLWAKDKICPLTNPNSFSGMR